MTKSFVMMCAVLLPCRLCAAGTWHPLSGEVAETCVVAAP